MSKGVPKRDVNLFLKEYDVLCDSQTYHDEQVCDALSTHSGLRTLYRRWESDELSDDTDDFKFDRAVLLFNSRDYYQCHDILEAIWNRVEEPQRTIVHGLLQCAVGLYHLANQNHRGAMMELGEGRCKLRKMNFRSGPFQQFEKEISAVLDFIYETQLELAACTDDLCLRMDGSDRSYQLLGSFGAGQKLYEFEHESDNACYINFEPEGLYSSVKTTRVKVPLLHATEEQLKAYEYDC
ncbi:hypothetical protein AMTR_s00101p00069530 [Amborella trichopoda]|uniref:DUF309 domain-containing protein n=1 Tax=Amborella trichopoda TaxID=13333 RepID=W1NQ57_AMBTC|nr:hypothetical protein AMTR_s00101p00069530 [Amborella trichopoda]